MAKKLYRVDVSYQAYFGHKKVHTFCCTGSDCSPCVQEREPAWVEHDRQAFTHALNKRNELMANPVAGFSQSTPVSITTKLVHNGQGFSGGNWSLDDLCLSDPAITIREGIEQTNAAIAAEAADVTDE